MYLYQWFSCIVQNSNIVLFLLSDYAFKLKVINDVLDGYFQI